MLNREEILDALKRMVRNKGRSNLIFKREIEAIIDEAESEENKTAEEKLEEEDEQN